MIYDSDRGLVRLRVNNRAAGVSLQGQYLVAGLQISEELYGSLPGLQGSAEPGGKLCTRESVGLNISRS